MKGKRKKVAAKRAERITEKSPSPANAGRNQAGRWCKGTSGNPAGKPPGTRHRATQVAETILEGETEALTRKAIELALDGDTTALRLCLERVIPVCRDAPVSLDLPSIESAADLPKAISVLLRATGDGVVTPSESERLARLLGGAARAIELTEIEQRLQELEAKSNET